MEYLDFELPIKELEDQLDKCQVIGQESDVDVSTTCKQIEKKLEETKRNIYKNLSAWQRVQLSRHPNRPYTLEHITNLTKGTFLELFGDRNFKDDKAMIGGFGNQPYLRKLIGDGRTRRIRRYIAIDRKALDVEPHRSGGALDIVRCRLDRGRLYRGGHRGRDGGVKCCSALRRRHFDARLAELLQPLGRFFNQTGHDSNYLPKPV